MPHNRLTCLVILVCLLALCHALLAPKGLKGKPYFDPVILPRQNLTK